MHLVKTVTRVQFSEAGKPWLEMRDLMRAAAADNKIELQSGPLVMDRKDAKTRVILQLRAVSIECEAGGDLGEDVNIAKDALTRLNESSPFSELVSIRRDAIFIEPFEVPFHEVVAHLKRKFLTTTRISEQSTDLALIFDKRDEGLLEHVQIGPMDRAQLMTEYLIWGNKDEIPDTFVFIALGYERRSKEEFSLDTMRTFFQDATIWQEAEGTTLVAELKES